MTTLTGRDTREAQVPHRQDRLPTIQQEQVCYQKN